MDRPVNPRRTRSLLLGLILAAALGGHAAQAQTEPQAPSVPESQSSHDPSLLLPRPAELVLHDAVFLLGAHATVIVDSGDLEAHPGATQLAHLLRRVSGQDVPIQLGDVGDAEFGAWAVRLRPDRTEFGAEGYRLRIEPEQVRLVAATRKGLLAALTTLRQLLPEQGPRSGEPAWEILLPCLRLQDAPAVPVRGLALRLGARTPDQETLAALVEQLARHKFNRLRLVGPADELGQDLLDVAKRVGVAIVQGGPEPDGSTGLSVPLQAPTDWVAATQLPAVDGQPAWIEATLALDEVPPGALDAWLWPRLVAIAEASWAAPDLADGPDGSQPDRRDHASFAARLLFDLARLSADEVAWFVPVPERLGTQGVFDGTFGIALHNPGPVGRVHVTTDGSDPDPGSPVVTGSITGTGTGTGSTTVRARVFVDDQHASDELVFHVRQEPALAPDAEPADGLVVGPLRAADVSGPVGMLRFEGWIQVDATGVYAFDSPTGGRCELTLGTGETARRFLLPNPVPGPAETVLGAGLHRAHLDWWPTDPDAELDLSWRRTDVPDAVAEPVRWLTQPPPDEDD